MKPVLSIIYVPLTILSLLLVNQERNSRKRLADESELSDTTFNLSGSDLCVNVMGKQLPSLPSFRVLSKKQGTVRGYVKDITGQPLAGAYIGIRSSAVGGYYSSASGETDEKGYYEIAVPAGSAHFYAACYTVEYGEGYLPLGLCAADGKTGSFTSAKGEVENFVLLAYGIADKMDAAERPWYAPNYFGGAIRISYDLGEKNDRWASKGCLSENDEIEISIICDRYSLVGNKVRSFTICKKTGNTSLTITNIPIGQYMISARLKNGKALLLKENGFMQHPLFGLKPKETTGAAMVLFTPGISKTPGPNRGNWDPVEIKLEKQ